MEISIVDKKLHEATPIAASENDGHSSEDGLTMRTNRVRTSLLSGPKNDDEISSSVAQMADDHLNLNDNDVLCGRGRVIHKHPGNRRFRRLISANKADYARCEKNSHKYFLALSIVLAIERQGGRFVKWSDERNENSCLILISRKDAIAKTAQALRDQLNRGGGGCSNRPRGRSSNSTSPIVATKQLKSRIDPDSEGMDIDDDGVQKINAQSPYSEDGSREESSSDGSSNDSSASYHSNDMDCDTGYSSPTLAMMALSMNPCTNMNAPISEQPFPASGMVAHHPTSTSNTTSNPGHDGFVGFPSTAPGHEKLWIPEELEALVHSDPNVARALTSLE